MGKPTGRKVALASGIALLLLLPIGLWTTWPEIAAWYKFHQLFESTGRNEQGYAEYRHRQTGIVFVSLPGGTFLMGSPEDEEGHNWKEGPVHEVTLSPFMIAKFEVTQAQWEKVMGVGSNPSDFKGENFPVDLVSWDDLHASDGFLKRTGFVLPTEAQWEYACRAGTPGPFAGTGNIDDMGWYDKKGQEIVTPTGHPVGLKQPNQFGLHDMHGNVSEWCEDIWDENFYSSPGAGGLDPVRGTAGSDGRVRRGGSRFSRSLYCRSASRGRYSPTVRSDMVGFRPAVPTP